jgi:hypothetical protein
MKALTLWQPWASLIVMGHKRFETRSWKRDSLIGERISINAAKRPPKDLPHELAALDLDPLGLPLGAVLGTAVVTGNIIHRAFATSEYLKFSRHFQSFSAPLIDAGYTARIPKEL